MRLPKPRIDPNLVLIFCAALLVSAALLSPNFFLEAHDARHSAYFLMQFDQDVRDGGIPPRWSNDSNYGYGYCVFVLYPPLAFIAGEALHLLGLGFIDAVKGVYALGFLFSGLTMYWFARRWLGPGGALIAALAYMVAPYHLADIYVRGTLAEFTAFALFPWALGAFHDLVERGGPRHVALAALSYGLVLLTHMAALVMFTGFLGVYIVFLVGYRVWREWRARKDGKFLSSLSSLLMVSSLVAFALLLALVLSAGFWLSMLEGTTAIDQSEFIVARADWRRFFVYADQFFSPFWGYGYAGEGHHDDMGYQLGVVGVVLGVLSLWAIPRLRDREARAQTAFFLAATAALLLLMMAVTTPVWSLAGSLAFTVQFPWRLLTLSSLTLSFLAGAAVTPYVWPWDASQGLRRLAPLALVVILAATPYIVPQWTPATPITPKTLMEFELSHNEVLGTMRWNKAKPVTSPMVAQYLAEEPLVKGHALSEGATAETLRVGGHSADFRVSSPSDTALLVYTQYFPGWSAWVDGQPASVYISDPDGLIVVHVPAGEHIVSVRLLESPVRLAGDVLSVIGLTIVIALFLVPPLWRRVNLLSHTRLLNRHSVQAIDEEGQHHDGSATR